MINKNYWIFHVSSINKGLSEHLKATNTLPAGETKLH